MSEADNEQAIPQILQGRDRPVPWDQLMGFLDAGKKDFDQKVPISEVV